MAADNSTNPIASFQPQNETQGVSVTYQGIAKTARNATSTLTLDGKAGGNILLHTNGSTGSPAQKLDVAGSATGSGSVGIGTSSPDAKLTVQPATNGEVGLRVTNGVADGTGVALLALPNGLAAGVYVVRSGRQTQLLAVE